MNAYNLESPQRKLVMWYKIRELFEEKHLKKRQIARELGIDVKTVRRYLKMDYSEFMRSGSYKRMYERILDPYEGQIREWLGEHQDLSSAQVHDWLKEKYGDKLPIVNDKTVYNYVSHIRLKYEIAKPSVTTHRQYVKLEESPYGESAQVDFGEMWMESETGRRLKVYFFVMVLCRSRKKYVYISTTPFTSEKTVYAHEKAFEYYGGKPKELIYDQDAVLIHGENLGDYMLTTVFKSFADQEHLKATFCKKSDPESKGKVENAVKYVKQNFLHCRTFKDIDTLNAECLNWLDRTGNGTVNAATLKVPDEVFEEEKKYLLPYHGHPTIPSRGMIEHHVLKTNIIRYRSNDYSLPKGSFKGPGTMVWIDDLHDHIDIYDKETGKLIATQPVPEDKGNYVVDPKHRERSHEAEDALEKKIMEYCCNDSVAKSWMNRLKVSKPRYYKSNLRVLADGMVHFDISTMHKVFCICLDSGMFNAKDLIKLCDRYGSRKSEDADGSILASYNQSDLIPDQSYIESFNSIIDGTN